MEKGQLVRGALPFGLADVLRGQLLLLGLKKPHLESKRLPRRIVGFGSLEVLLKHLLQICSAVDPQTLLSTMK